ncbi:hypothetical protein SAMN05880574_12732 [Chryseobacterium sp. RU37D]|uniref:hypothetical protein n=1 Tax=Chryseobacterium sp. RU37D TaxID=1907397 RepID=UPI00095510E6|nr:hypothetical protein [Chryseobacterium sp. RU37D]SIQ82645.1 hypothetical protein SAMN05880574_12732 [Chryseobacterium sp. RU37D]
MNSRNIINRLKSGHFVEINNKGSWFEDGSTIYAKEIKDNIFLLFIVLKDLQIENMRVLIAHFESFQSIGIRKPAQIMFYLSIKSKEDLHYFEKYLCQLKTN